ncbi:SDR family oxidoreductase [Streptomyces sp. NPDC092296]|uniref:SDR family oxidoreductase n=1 Tax=Streptomyces sp. NPDC092296 TaxID=3366012 RepID=UPI003816088E
MSTVVTGATGHLGRLVVEALLRRGVEPSEIVATGRDIGKIKDLADRGVTVRRADFTDSDSLTAAFAGAEKLLLVSTDALGSRTDGHRRAIDVARAAGVTTLAYTSITKADSARMTLATEHRETEQYLQAGGAPFVILRNSWYLENYTGQLATYLEHGSVLGSAGQGLVSAATRADYAEAAAVVLTTEGHQGTVYELGGDQPFTLSDLAAALSAATGREISYTDLPAPAYAEVLTGAGVPQGFAEVLADADLGLARGELRTDSGDLRRLLGRPTTTLAAAISAALAAQPTA